MIYSIDGFNLFRYLNFLKNLPVIISPKRIVRFAIALCLCYLFTNCVYSSREYIPPPTNTAEKTSTKRNVNKRYKILEKGRHSDVELANFLIKNNRGITFNNAHYLASLYVLEARDEGVNPTPPLPKCAWKPASLNSMGW